MMVRQPLQCEGRINLPACGVCVSQMSLYLETGECEVRVQVLHWSANWMQLQGIFSVSVGSGSKGLMEDCMCCREHCRQWKGGNE